MSNPVTPTNSDIIQSLATLKIEYDSLKVDVATLRADIKGLADSFSQSRQWNWPVVLTGVIACGVIFGGAFTLADKNATILLSPVLSENQVSITDRTDLHKSVDTLRGESINTSTELKSFESMVKSNLKEIETQFKAQEQLINLARAGDIRRMNEIQDACNELGAKIPKHQDNPYFHPSLMSGGGDGSDK